MNEIDRALGAAATLFRALANLSLIVMLGANAANIALRGVFGFSLGWVFPWSMVFLVWLVFFGFFVYVRAGRDIGVEFMVRRFPMAARRIAAALANLVTLAIVVIMLWNALDLLDVQAGKLEMVDLDRRALSIPLFASCILIAVQTVLSSVQVLTGRREPFAEDHDRDANITTGATS